MNASKYGIVFLLCLVVIAGVVFTRYLLYEPEELLLDSLRRDLVIPKHVDVTIVRKTPNPRFQGRCNRAIILISDDSLHTLKNVWRGASDEPAHLQTWQIDWMSYSDTDGGGGAVFYEKDFDHPPTTSELDEFEKWCASL